MTSKSLVVGILPEAKNKWEKRAPLSPRDVAWLIRRDIRVEIASSRLRIFKDAQYRRAGAHVVQKLGKAKLILGIKEPPVKALIPNSIYMVFSHTAKGQIQNRELLQAFLKNRITLTDYEHITDLSGQRLAYFGRFAGICGMIDTLHVFGQKVKTRGVQNPFSILKSAVSYGSYGPVKATLNRISKSVRNRGFDKRLAPFVIGITGHGNVSRGAQEVLDLLGAVSIHPKDMDRFIRNRRSDRKKIYKLVFQREEKLRSKDGTSYYFEEYLSHPERFKSNMDQYLPFLNILVNASYWDRRYPRLVPEAMVRRLYRAHSGFRLSVIGDLTCDLNGTIEITKRITTPSEPAFLYNPKTGKIHTGASGKGIAVMAIDNLPCEFPKESSTDFSGQIRDYVYQIAAHGALDITHHHALPREIRDAVVTQNGKLTPRFKYL